jgi:hypothetical protein
VINCHSNHECHLITNAFLAFLIQVRNRKLEYKGVRAAKIGVPVWFERCYPMFKAASVKGKRKEVIKSEIPATRPCSVVVERLELGSPIPLGSRL